MINRVIITGNLTNTPELKKTETGTSMIRFSIAQNQKNHTDYFNVTAFNKLAENIARYCKKGMLVCVDGRLNTWKDAKEVTHTDISAYNVQFISKTEEPAEQESEELPW